MDNIYSVKLDERLAYSVAEMAELLNIGLNSAYKMTKMDGFPKIVIGRRVIIPAAALDAFLIKLVNCE